MENQKNLQGSEINHSNEINFSSLPTYHTDMAAEREFFSPESVEKRSYSFAVGNPLILAGENIIFDPSPIRFAEVEEDESYHRLD